MPTEQEYTISELADLAGVTPRTVRYYVSIGLLSSPGQVGPKTRYGDGHLQRLHLIRKLQREHLPLGEITTRLEGLDEEAIEQALEADGSPAAPGSALEYIRSLQEGPEALLESMVLAEAAPPPLSLRMAAEPEPTDTSIVQRTQWERVALSQNVELHIRRPLSRHDHKRVDRLIRIGREMLEQGDQS